MSARKKETALLAISDLVTLYITTHISPRVSKQDMKEMIESGELSLGEIAGEFTNNLLVLAPAILELKGRDEI
jgi:hypothetical protein